MLNYAMSLGAGIKMLSWWQEKMFCMINFITTAEDSLWVSDLWCLTLGDTINSRQDIPWVVISVKSWGFIVVMLCSSVWILGSVFSMLRFEEMYVLNTIYMLMIVSI